jgi:hypothetical protein
MPLLSGGPSVKDRVPQQIPVINIHHCENPLESTDTNKYNYKVKRANNKSSYAFELSYLT